MLAYQEIAGGALTTALTPDDVTAMVVKYLEAEDVDVSRLKPDQVEALVNKFSEATGCDRSALAQSLTGYITSYDDSSAALPSPSCRLSISGYDLSALNAVLEKNPIKVDGILRLGQKYENPSDVLGDENARFYYNGEEIPVNLVPSEKLTAETIIAYDTDGTLHVIITPEIGSPEALEQSSEDYESTPLDNTSFRWLSESVHDEVTDINEAAAALSEYKAQIDALKESGVDTAMNGMDQAFRAQQSEVVGMIDDLTNRQGDLETTATLALNLWQALSSGELDEATAQEYAAQLQEILNLVNAADEYIGVWNELSTYIAQGMQEYGWEGDAETLAGSLQAAIAGVMPQVGDDVGAGIGQGEAAHDFSGDAETTIANDESALRNAASSHSPAARFNPLGEDIAAGIGQGMSKHDFGAESNAAISGLMGALSTALSAQAARALGSARAVGSAITRGIASGIQAGQSTVVAAAVQVVMAALAAAKTAMGIRSPSRVFRDEVGLMAMKGMGEGFLAGQAEQARIIRNAARYLTDEAREGAVAGQAVNNRTYNQSRTVNLNVSSMQIRDKQDIRSLAIEIASLTRMQQRGRGLRMA